MKDTGVIRVGKEKKGWKYLYALAALVGNRRPKKI